MRADILLLHYTGMKSCERAIAWLADPRSKVSCHYVVDTDGTITQMVPEGLRAWHAGVSYWAGIDDVNSHSIGIEIHNPGHDDGYPMFPEAQMHAVIALCRDIVARNEIRPERVLAHSDVAPSRKIDPGEKFDWARLSRAGVGHWVEPAAPTDAVASDQNVAASSMNRAAEADQGRGTEASSHREVSRARALLAAYGYAIPLEGSADADFTTVVRAFQRHFRPQRVDGLLDASTLDTLERLVAALGQPARPSASLD